MCVSGIGFQFHTPGTKDNILNILFLFLFIYFFFGGGGGGGGNVLNQKLRISGIFKKSVLDFKDTVFGL